MSLIHDLDKLLMSASYNRNNNNDDDDDDDNNKLLLLIKQITFPCLDINSMRCTRNTTNEQTVNHTINISVSKQITSWQNKRCVNEELRNEWSMRINYAMHILRRWVLRPDWKVSVWEREAVAQAAPHARDACWRCDITRWTSLLIKALTDIVLSWQRSVTRKDYFSTMLSTLFFPLLILLSPLPIIFIMLFLFKHPQEVQLINE